MQEKYNVTGMTCAACQARVQKSVSNLTGVQECNVNLLKNSMVVTSGLPIATYMKEYRVHQAMKLLRETDATIADIAARVGYETQGKFSKAFKDVTQVLPTEYRKMQY